MASGIVKYRIGFYLVFISFVKITSLGIRSIVVDPFKKERKHPGFFKNCPMQFTKFASLVRTPLSND